MCLACKAMLVGPWNYAGRSRWLCLNRFAMTGSYWFPSRYRPIAQAVWSGAAARILSSAVTLISLPLAVRYLGTERFGVWATITTTVVWINLLDLGIANTLTNHISRAYALEDKTAAARYFTNSLLLTTFIS